MSYLYEKENTTIAEELNVPKRQVACWRMKYNRFTNESIDRDHDLIDFAEKLDISAHDAYNLVTRLLL